LAPSRSQFDLVFAQMEKLTGQVLITTQHDPVGSPNSQRRQAMRRKTDMVELFERETLLPGALKEQSALTIDRQLTFEALAVRQDRLVGMGSPEQKETD
jgi:hypothetical protein